MRLCLLSFAIAILACSHSATAPGHPTPDYRPVTVHPAPPTAKLYADCLAAAIANTRYASASDDSTHTLLFTCTGAAAQAFYEALAGYSARIGSQFVFDGRTYRSTQRVIHDLFGVDYCATDGTTHECVLTLNVGEFAAESPR